MASPSDLGEVMPSVERLTFGEERTKDALGGNAGLRQREPHSGRLVELASLLETNERGLEVVARSKARRVRAIGLRDESLHWREASGKLRGASAFVAPREMVRTSSPSSTYNKLFGEHLVTPPPQESPMSTSSESLVLEFKRVARQHPREGARYLPAVQAAGLRATAAGRAEGIAKASLSSMLAVPSTT
jgi:hypothetical protein